jgi:hypothetical protein
MLSVLGLVPGRGPQNFLNILNFPITCIFFSYKFLITFSVWMYVSL